MRTAFQIDADRIMGCTAFERLRDKTHLLLAPRGEGYRSRMDHTLFGARIAKSLGRALRLNEDLIEAIAMGRDLGATAFARAGDEALSLFTEEPFRHPEQSMRIVERLERGGEGLNLTWEVRDGIATHSTDAPMPATREGEAVRVADRIACAVGEVRDALLTGVVLQGDLPNSLISRLGENPSVWVDTLLEDAVGVSENVPEVHLSGAAAELLTELETFAADQISGRHGVLAERARGAHCLSSLIVFYTDNPDRLPALHRNADAPEMVRVVDFISSLSDSQALRLFNQLLLPRRSPHRL